MLQLLPPPTARHPMPPSTAPLHIPPQRIAPPRLPTLAPPLRPPPLAAQLVSTPVQPHAPEHVDTTPRQVQQPRHAPAVPTAATTAEAPTRTTIPSTSPGLRAAQSSAGGDHRRSSARPLSGSHMSRPSSSHVSATHTRFAATTHAQQQQQQQHGDGMNRSAVPRPAGRQQSGQPPQRTTFKQTQARLTIVSAAKVTPHAAATLSSSSRRSRVSGAVSSRHASNSDA